MTPIYRQTCRVCGNPNLKIAVDLGKQFLQGSFVKEGYITPPLRMLPTQLVRCDVSAAESACGLLQLAHTFPPEILYANYWYNSGTNNTMKKHLKDIVDQGLQLSNIRGPGRVLDIGCNDGTLLGCYPEEISKYGVDPSNIAKRLCSEGITLINTTFPSESARQILSEKTFDIVTSIAMFYDLEDPVLFAKEVKSLLKEDGIWIFEMSYMPLMLFQNSYDTICHEHLEYYSLSSIEYILKLAGFRLFKVDLNEINGGSIRCFAVKADNVSYDDDENRNFITRLRIREFELALDTPKPYENFVKRISRLRDDLCSLLNALKEKGKTVHVYGASTKGNVILQWCGIDSKIINFASDRNLNKVGASTLGTNIKVISEEDSRKMAPDYYLVLPWHFKKEFLEREEEALMRGAEFIFPLPEISIVNKFNYAEYMSLPENDFNIIIENFFNEPL
jgi:SAM-dependent methyltransferase